MLAYSILTEMLAEKSLKTVLNMKDILNANLRRIFLTVHNTIEEFILRIFSTIESHLESVSEVYLFYSKFLVTYLVQFKKLFGWFL